MILKEPQRRFALPARFLHWFVAVAIPVQIYLGWAAEWEEARAESFRLIQNHFQLGTIIFGAMVLRIAWRVGYGSPTALDEENRWRKSIAATVHWLIYGLLLALPVSGYIIWVWMDAPMGVLGVVELPILFTPPAEDEFGRALAWYVHFYSSWALIALIGIHITAAFWHQLFRRDNLIFERML